MSLSLSITNNFADRVWPITCKFNIELFSFFKNEKINLLYYYNDYNGSYTKS